jgi:adenine phosphoribosyltransferase
VSDVDLRSLVRDIPDFPQPGIVFKDITPIMADAAALDAAITALATDARERAGGRIDVVIAAEARGFLLGPAVARELGAGFVLARKPGKLPWETVRAEYLLEYGSARWSCTPTPSAPARGCSSTTTSWPRAARRRRCARWPSSSAAPSSAAAS